MPLVPTTDEDRRFLRLAIQEGEKTFRERGVPVGSVMVRDGQVVATGRNQAFQTNDPTSHGETDCIRNAGFIERFDSVTLYTTLSPCMMCTGAMLFLGIPKVVIGDRETYPGDVDFLLARGMQVALADDADCIGLMRRFIAEYPELWGRITAGERS
jgi:cytosine/creatinine deaminase